MAAKQQHAVVLVLGGLAAGLSGRGLCNGSLLVNLLTLMAMHGVVNIFLGKIGKIIPKLFGKWSNSSSYFPTGQNSLELLVLASITSFTPFGCR